MRLTLFSGRGRRLLVLAGAVALPACSGGTREPRQDVPEAARQRQANAARPAAVPLINLPAALPLGLPGFIARFGNPQPLATDFVDPGKGLPGAAKADSSVLFRPSGLSMVVSYRISSGAVEDVLLLGPDEAGLMRQAALVPNAAGYLLLPVFESRRTDRLLGLRVVPK